MMLSKLNKTTRLVNLVLSLLLMLTHSRAESNIEEVNDEGNTTLMVASREGHEEMVALLLSQVNLSCQMHPFGILGILDSVSLVISLNMFDVCFPRELTSTPRLRRLRRRP